MKDVTDLLHSLPSVGQTLEGFLFFVAPRIDFRQSASRVGDCLSGEGGDCLSVEGVRCVRVEAGQ